MGNDNVQSTNKNEKTRSYPFIKTISEFPPNFRNFVSTQKMKVCDCSETKTSRKIEIKQQCNNNP